ncbi:hypothetical protein IT570_11875 [Candidatus Sumerlaeota bacterium]|nr:hypothetical protein [Candidatus Sumerlaeota bacterium]
MRYGAPPGEVRPPKYASYFDAMFGIRTGFGERAETIHIAYETARRSKKVWVLPGFFGALILVVALSIAQEGIKMPYLIGRVILIDYLIFFFGWICGWSAAWRWRNDREFLEELVVTNQRPAVIGNLLFAGYLAAWFRVLVLIALVETAWGMVTTALDINLMAKGLIAWAEIFCMGFVPMLVTMALLVWFHLETLRIAYWMFSVPALPQVNLRQRAVTNLVLTALYVVLLTVLGSGVTGVCSAVAGGVLSLLGHFYPVKHIDIPTLSFFLGSIPGLLIVIGLKRYIVQLYEASFCRSYLLYCWYGAAETIHPLHYPPEITRHLTEWVTFLDQEEAEAALDRMKARNAHGKPPSGDAAT